MKITKSLRRYRKSTLELQIGRGHGVSKVEKQIPNYNE